MVQYWNTMAVHDDVRYNSSENCTDRSSLATKYARPAPPDPSRSHGRTDSRAQMALEEVNQQKYLMMSIAPDQAGVVPVVLPACHSCNSEQAVGVVSALSWTSVSL